MAVEGGKNWHKEVGAIGAAAETKRVEFYKERANNKLGTLLDDVLKDLDKNGYKTLADIRDKSASYEVHAGDTLFKVLQKYFKDNFSALSAEQIDKEVYLTLAYVTKINNGANVDFLDVGDKISISDGMLTVFDKNTQMRFSYTYMRPRPSSVTAPAAASSSVPATADPSAAPSTPSAPTEAPAKAGPDVSPPASTEPTKPVEAPTDKVVPLPSSTPDTGKEDTAADSSATKPDSEVDNKTPEAPEQKILTLEQINGSEIVSGKYVWSDEAGGAVSEGRFRGGYQIDGTHNGTHISDGGSFTQDGTFWESGNNHLKEGKVVSSQDGGRISVGSFNENGYIIDGVIKYTDGRIKYVFPAEKLSGYEALAKNKIPGAEFKKEPYQVDGNKVVFKEEGRIWGTNDLELVTVENPEKAKQLAAKLNERFQPVIKEKAAANAEKNTEAPATPASGEQPATTPATPVEATPAAPAQAPSSASSAPVAGPETPTE